MRTYQAAMAKWKQEDNKDELSAPKYPKLDRYVVENTTTEALSEVLRDDHDAKQILITHKPQPISGAGRALVWFGRRPK